MPVLIVEPRQSYPKWIHSALLGHDLIVNNEAEHRKHLTCEIPPEPAPAPAVVEDATLFDAVPAEFLDDDSQDDAKFENVIVPFDDVVVATAGRKPKKVKGGSK